jgi:hypothetical protein
MDANKLQVLRDLPYTVAPVCGLCRHGVFPTPHNDWGTCAALTYEHKKHTGPARQLSIVKYGSCAKFEADPVKTSNLQHYLEFLKT